MACWYIRIRFFFFFGIRYDTESSVVCLWLNSNLYFFVVDWKERKIYDQKISDVEFELIILMFCCCCWLFSIVFVSINDQQVCIRRQRHLKLVTMFSKQKLEIISVQVLNLVLKGTRTCFTGHLRRAKLCLLTFYQRKTPYNSLFN